MKSQRAKDNPTDSDALPPCEGIYRPSERDRFDGLIPGHRDHCRCREIAEAKERELVELRRERAQLISRASIGNWCLNHHEEHAPVAALVAERDAAQAATQRVATVLRAFEQYEELRQATWGDIPTDESLPSGGVPLREANALYRAAVAALRAANARS